MALENLPVELIFEIARHLEEPRNFNNFVKVNRTLYAILNHDLYQENITVHGSQALFWAIKFGRDTTAARLLSMGANPNARTLNKKATTLQLAAFHGRLGVVKMLLDYGADAGVKTSKVPGPLELALLRKHEEVAKTVADYRRGLPKGLALRTAAQNCLLKTIHWLLDSGEDVNAKTHTGRTPLWFALNSSPWTEESLEAILLLLKNGAGPGCLESCGPQARLSSARCKAFYYRNERVKDLFGKLKKTCHCPLSWGTSPGEFRAFHQRSNRQDFHGPKLPVPNMTDYDGFPSVTMHDLDITTIGTTGSSPGNAWSAIRAERLKENLKRAVNSPPTRSPDRTVPTPVKFPDLRPGHTETSRANEPEQLWQGFRNQRNKGETQIFSDRIDRRSSTAGKRARVKRRWESLEL